MKKLRAITFFLIAAGFALFLAYRLSRSPQIPGDREPSQTTATQCDQSLWEYVYNPGRLRVLDSCISVTGTVEEIRKEADGDVHILFRLDQQFESLLNEKNFARQYGDLVLEPICQGKVRQADAAEPCSRYVVPILNRRSASALQSRVPTSATPTMVERASPCHFHAANPMISSERMSIPLVNSIHRSIRR